MTIDQVDQVDSRAWLTLELWSSEFKIMVSEIRNAMLPPCFPTCFPYISPRFKRLREKNTRCVHIFLASFFTKQQQNKKSRNLESESYDLKLNRVKVQMHNV